MNQKLTHTLDQVQRELLLARKQLEVLQEEILRLSGTQPSQKASLPAIVVQDTQPMSKRQLFKMIPEQHLADFGGHLSDVVPTEMPPPIPMQPGRPAPETVRLQPSSARPPEIAPSIHPARITRPTMSPLEVASRGNTAEVKPEGIAVAQPVGFKLGQPAKSTRPLWLYGIVSVLSLLLGCSLFLLIRFGLTENPPHTETVTEKPRPPVTSRPQPPAARSNPTKTAEVVPVKPPAQEKKATPVQPAPRVEPVDASQQQQAVAAAYRLLARKDYKKALTFLQGWVERAPGNPKLRYLLGRALFYNHELKAALLQMQAVIDLDPRFAEAYFELGGLYIHLRQAVPARQALTEFLRLMPDDPRAYDVRALLKNHPLLR